MPPQVCYNRRRYPGREMVNPSVIRNLLTIMILVATAAWLVLSYVPVDLPQFPLNGELSQALFPWLVGLVLMMFVVIQAVLVRATVRIVKSPPDAETRAVVRLFRLRVGAEVFWTALPLAMTIILAMTIYLLGSNVPS